MLEVHADRVNSQNPANVQCAPLGNCQKEVKVHLKLLIVFERILTSRVANATSKGRYSMNLLMVILSGPYCSKKHKVTNFTSNRMYKIISRDYYLELRLTNF